MSRKNIRDSVERSTDIDSKASVCDQLENTVHLIDHSLCVWMKHQWTRQVASDELRCEVYTPITWEKVYAVFKGSNTIKFHLNNLAIHLNQDRHLYFGTTYKS